MGIQGGFMEFVYCPSCGDPVAGALLAEGEAMECAHCQDKFPFERRNLRSGIVVYDENARRWKVGKPPRK